MRLTIQIDGGPRVTFEDVPRRAFQEAFQLLLESNLSVSAALTETATAETPLRHPRPARRSSGRTRVPGEKKNAKTAAKTAIEVAENVLGDGRWHLKSEVVNAWRDAGLNVLTAAHAMSGLQGLERSRRSRHAWWRVPRVPVVDLVGESVSHGTFEANGRVS